MGPPIHVAESFVWLWLSSTPSGHLWSLAMLRLYCSVCLLLCGHLLLRRSLVDNDDPCAFDDWCAFFVWRDMVTCSRIQSTSLEPQTYCDWSMGDATASFFLAEVSTMSYYVLEHISHFVFLYLADWSKALNQWTHRNPCCTAVCSEVSTSLDQNLGCQ